MTKSKKRIDRAGIYLLRYATEHMADDKDDVGASDVALKVLELAELDMAECETNEEKYKVMAAKHAALSILRHAKGTEPKSDLEMFQSTVEAVEGGPRVLDIGGKHITNKKTVRENWLLAAAIHLWKSHPENRDELVKEARKLLGIQDKKAMARIVDNHDQRDGNPAKPSPLTDHMKLIKMLSEKYEWTSLKDF